MTDLRRHIPAIALTWDDEAPGQLWRSIEGTLVFADISGFTALTERLSARGRIGAEQIIETLNGIFATMLTAAAARGGELLKFGGDALFFLFRGQGHAQRACDAAIEMRGLLRATDRDATGARLRLSMSVGIHSGDLLFFLVGSPTRELLILGPAATAVADTEKAADAGQILLTPATAAQLPRGWTRPTGDLLALTRRRPSGPAAGGVPDHDAIPRQRLATLFPFELGAYLDDHVPEPEHRNACIAFARFSGTDALLGESGTQAVADAVHTVVTALQAALAVDGVTLLATDLDADGGKFFLGSGVPRASEDDEGRMLRAMRALADADLPLPLQIGVNRGHVFTAEVGADFRAAYSAMGDTTNTAARIMGKAPPGAIYAAPPVLEHARTAFQTRPVGPFPMKGKREPVTVYEVGAEAGPRQMQADSDLIFLGRDAELVVLAGCLSRVCAGTGCLVTVSGPTGTGKSRLVAEALRDVPDVPVLELRGEPYGAGSAYRLFRDPVRSLLGLTPDTSAAMGEQLLAVLRGSAPELLPLAPLLADLLQVEVPPTTAVVAIDPQYRPDRLADVVIALLHRMRPGPLLIVLEEGHWADAASVRLLARIADATTSHPWGLVVVRREEGGGFDPAVGERIGLAPLPDAVMEQLIIEASGATPLRPHEIAAIVDRAAGSPLFVVEVLRAAVGGSSLEALPDSIGGAIAAQIDQLQPQVRRVLRHCSVLGRSFRRSVLQATLRADGVTVDAATMQDLGGFLAEDGPRRYRFRNSLVRDAAYDGLAYRTRARLHRLAGDVTERMSSNLDADAATLSLHFAQAGDHARTWRYARRAGDAARRSYANADAAIQFERALEAVRRVRGVPDGEVVALLTALAQVRELAGVFDGAIDAYRRAARLQPDPAARAEIIIRKARVQERAGAYRGALQSVAAARRLLRGVDPAMAPGVEARLDTLLALIRLGQERPGQARAAAVRAVAAARQADDPETLVKALMAVDNADSLLGRPVDGTCTREALRVCLEHGFRPLESVARANLGGYAFYAGRWTESVEWFASSRQAALDAGNAFGAAETDLSVSEILISQRRTDEAEPLLQNAIRVLGVSGMTFARTYGEMLLAGVYRANGDLPRADETGRRAAAEFAAMGHHLSALEATLVPARVACESGDPEQALALLDAAEAAAKGEAVALLPRTSLERARALRALGRRDEAASAVADGLAAAREMCLAYEEALLLLADADVTGSDAARAEVPRARRILADLGARLD